MTTACVIASLAAEPVVTSSTGRETLESFAQTTSSEPCSFLLRTFPGSRHATFLSSCKAGHLLIIAGDLTLQDDTPIIYAHALCNASPEQYLNEVVLVGRIAGESKVTASGKSASRSLAVNRFVKGEEITDWWKIRGYGEYMLERLNKATKGSLVSVTGCLEQRTSQSQQTYPEIKIRSLKLHGKSKPRTSESNAPGYSPEDFTGMNQMPHDWN